MPSITELSATVISELENNQAGALAWLSVRYYAKLVAQAADEWLVQVRQRFDLTAVVAACAGYQVYAGQRGQAATHRLATLCWALLLKHLNGWSYRTTSREIGTNPLLRWFVGYDLGEPTLSYVTLQRFAVWVATEQPRLFFNAILAQIDADFPTAAGQAQVGDTFALRAKVATQSRTALLRDACRRLLAYGQQGSGGAFASVLVAIDAEALFGAAHERPEYQLDKPERDALEARTALAAAGCLRLVTAWVSGLPPARTLEWLALQRWLDLLAKILSDEFVFTYDAAGVALTVRPCTQAERGRFVLGSAVDPEATFRKHGDKNDLGYNVQVASTRDFVREIFAQTGATPDASGVALLIEHQKEHLGLVPPKLIYDRAAGSPKIFHDVAQASAGQTQLVARLIDHSKNSDRYGPLDFTLNQDGALTCPNGQTSTTYYRSQAADGWQYRFSAAQCQGCPLWQRCRGGADAVAAPPTSPDAPTAPVTPVTPKTGTRKTPKPTAYRQVFISHYRERQRTALLYTKTDAFQRDMRFRATIERIIAALVRYHDARHARSVGLAQADFQVRMAATAYNLKKWHKLTQDKRKPSRHPPPETT